MENFFLHIKDVMFRLNLDNEMASQMLKRAPSLSNKKQLDYNIDIICSKVNEINFSDDKFLHQQEPDINEEFYYREIFDLGVFKYDRKEKILHVKYLNIDEYPFNSFEVVVDTILQFIYLIMLEFEIVPLHAAVLAHGKQAVLLFGNSGSGKTTLELSLLNSDFLFFSDDIAFLDGENYIYNSSESIVACSKKTEEILNKNFNVTFLDAEKENSANKKIINIDNAMISKHTQLVPSVIIFPTPGTLDANEKSLVKIQAKSSFVKLIEMTISTQFSSAQKQLYLKRLKQLSEHVHAFQYFWNSQKNDLKEVCCSIKELCD